VSRVKALDFREKRFVGWNENSGRRPISTRIDPQLFFMTSAIHQLRKYCIWYRQKRRILFVLTSTPRITSSHCFTPVWGYQFVQISFQTAQGELHRHLSDSFINQSTNFTHKLKTYNRWREHAQARKTTDHGSIAVVANIGLSIWLLMAWISIVLVKLYTLHVFDLAYSFEHGPCEEWACPITMHVILKQIMNWKTPG
jgi:hypothetical protein